MNQSIEAPSSSSSTNTTFGKYENMLVSLADDDDNGIRLFDFVFEYRIESYVLIIPHFNTIYCI
jgi:hypothetical protein